MFQFNSISRKKFFILQLIKLKRKRALEYVEKDEIDMCCSFQMHFLSSIFDAVIYLERSLCRVWKSEKKFSFKKYFVKTAHGVILCQLISRNFFKRVISEISILCFTYLFRRWFGVMHQNINFIKYEITFGIINVITLKWHAVFKT